MKRIISLILASILIILMCSSCEIENSTTIESSDDAVQVSYIAEFYDNHGSQWLSVEGTSFNISPNKVKEYSYDSDGSWISQWTTSSVMSITIDNQHIESCGSTIIFYDTSLEKMNIDIPEDITLSKGDSANISSPYDGYNYYEDMWGLGYWYWTEKQDNRTVAARIVVIQSQEGDPICMFAGNEVSWSVSRNLPKTTEVIIDGRVVYIHRSNFSIIDTSIFE